jgi:hypothetical protein
MRLSQNR